MTAPTSELLGSLNKDNPGALFPAPPGVNRDRNYFYKGGGGRDESVQLCCCFQLSGDIVFSLIKYHLLTYS